MCQWDKYRGGKDATPGVMPRGWIVNYWQTPAMQVPEAQSVP